MMSVNFDAMSDASQSMFGQSQKNFRSTFRSHARDNESHKVASRASKRDADPMRQSSMKFFKEAFENISLHHGSDSMSTLFMREKQKADQEKSNVR